MKTLEFKNEDLLPLINTVKKISVSPQKQVRGQGKLLKALQKKHEEYADDFSEFKKKYFKMTEDGKEFELDGNSFVYKDEFDNKEGEDIANEELKELDEEIAVLNLVEHETKIKSFFEALEKDEFSTEEKLDADHFDTLMDALELAFETEGGEK